MFARCISKVWNNKDKTKEKLVDYTPPTLSINIIQMDEK